MAISKIKVNGTTHDVKDNSKLPLTGGTLTGNLTIKNSATLQSGQPAIVWGTFGANSNRPYVGFAQDQTDGTFILGNLKSANYADGLAIGGGSGNLLWKGFKVVTVNDVPDTKNTAGSTNSSSKLYLIGATSQAANPQTYSHDTAYVGTDGCLYSGGTKVSVEGHTHDGRYYTETEVDTKLAGKANSSHGNHVPATQTANNATFLRNDNTWQTVTPANIGAAASSHTHNYAGSSSAGGSATSAVKLDTATAGSATQPVYFSGGKPVATTYTLGKSVPSNAVFTDTDTKVTQTVRTTNGEFPILLRGTSAGTTTTTTTTTFGTKMTANPSNGELTATGGLKTRYFTIGTFSDSNVMSQNVLMYSDDHGILSLVNGAGSGGQCTIRGISTPAVDTDVTNKEYVDGFKVSGTGAITVALADNTNYTYTAVTSLNMTRGSGDDAWGMITFGTSAPSVSTPSGFAVVAGDDITTATANSVWEFNHHKGYIVFKKWSA